MTRARIDLRRPSGFHGPLQRTKAASWSLAMLTCVWLCSTFVPPSLLTYLLIVFPCGVIIVSAIARINDLKVEMASTIWNVRRNGLILVALFALQVLFQPMVEHEWPSWRLVLGVWGFAMVWLTTPGQPPWHEFVWHGIHGDTRVEQRRRSTDAPP